MLMYGGAREDDVLLDKASARPLFLQLEDWLRSQIDSGRLKVGDRIPSELELSDTFRISRMTARRAVEELVTEGVLFRQPGKGTFVAQPKLSYPPPTALSFSTAMRAMGFAVTTQVLDKRIMPAPARIARDLRLEPDQEVIFLRRLRFVENEPMAIHMSYVPRRRFEAILQENLTLLPLNKIMEEVAGIRIAGSRDYVEAALARPDEADLLGIRVGGPLLLIRGVVYAENGVPVRSTNALFRGDHFRFFVGSNNLLEVRAPGAGQSVAEPEAQWVTMSSER